MKISNTKNRLLFLSSQDCSCQSISDASYTVKTVILLLFERLAEVSHQIVICYFLHFNHLGALYIFLKKHQTIRAPIILKENVKL